jgi:hypothetical protein
MPPLAQSLTLLIKLSRQGRMIALRFLSLRTGWHALAILQKTWSPICPKKRLPSGNKPIKDLANAVAPDHDAGDAVTGWVVRITNGAVQILVHQNPPVCALGAVSWSNEVSSKCANRAAKSNAQIAQLLQLKLVGLEHRMHIRFFLPGHHFFFLVTMLFFLSGQHVAIKCC